MQGNEGTFTFLETVLKEVLELFPSQHIHIGGDEVTLIFSPSFLECHSSINLKVVCMVSRKNNRTTRHPGSATYLQASYQNFQTFGKVSKST